MLRLESKTFILYADALPLTKDSIYSNTKTTLILYVDNLITYVIISSVRLNILEY